MVKKFAQGTEVPVERSRSQIEALLRKHGADAFAVAFDGRYSRVQFRMKERFVRYDLELPELDVFRNDERVRWRSDRERRAAALRDAEERRLWRALNLIIKAKLEAVSSGIETFEEAFLARILASDQQTIGELTRPWIAEMYSTGHVPKQLLSGGKSR